MTIIVSDKLKATGINPYVINWIITFLNHWKQRLILYGIVEFIDINRGIPQATVLGPTIFSLVDNDIQLADPRDDPMVKFADGITIRIPISKMVLTRQLMKSTVWNIGSPVLEQSWTFQKRPKCWYTGRLPNLIHNYWYLILKVQ